MCLDLCRTDILPGKQCFRLENQPGETRSGAVPDCLQQFGPGQTALIQPEKRELVFFVLTYVIDPGSIN